MAKRYTVGGLLAALKPAGFVHVWQDRAYCDSVWYNAPFRLHKTDLIDALKKLDPSSPCMPYYVTEHTYMRGTCERTARNVYVGSPSAERPNVIQDGDPEDD